MERNNSNSSFPIKPLTLQDVHKKKASMVSLIPDLNITLEQNDFEMFDASLNDENSTKENQEIVDVVDNTMHVLDIKLADQEKEEVHNTTHRAIKKKPIDDAKEEIKEGGIKEDQEIQEVEMEDLEVEKEETEYEVTEEEENEDEVIEEDETEDGVTEEEERGDEVTEDEVTEE